MKKSIDKKILNQVSEYFKFMYVPTSVVGPIRRISAKKLKTVHENVDISREVLFLIMTNLTSTYTSYEKSDRGSREEAGFKRLNSQILSSETRVGSKYPYAKGLKLLQEEGIIEMGLDYSVSQKRSREFRIAPKYFNFKVSKVKPTQEFSKRVLSRKEREFSGSFIGSDIATEFLRNRDRVTLPSEKETEEILLEAVKNDFRNRDGKKLKKRGKNRRELCGEFVYLEDYLNMYYIYKECFTIPKITGERAGNRVITPLNMLPKVIREHVKIDGEKIVGLDFICLHPNEVTAIYRGIGDMVTHDKVSEYLGISREQAKIEHLSFFNKEWDKMYISPLFKYYIDKDPIMMERVFEDKRKNGYRSTSRKMFSLETQLMEEITRRFRELGIVGIYVFDAMYVKESVAKEAEKIMNEVAKSFGINTKIG